MCEGNPKRQTALGDTCVEVFSDGGSIPPASTKARKLPGTEKAYEHRIFGLFMGFSAPFEQFFLPLKYTLFYTVLRG